MPARSGLTESRLSRCTQPFGHTLEKWKTQISNQHATRVTKAPTETANTPMKRTRTHRVRVPELRQLTDTGIAVHRKARPDATEHPHTSLTHTKNPSKASLTTQHNPARNQPAQPSTSLILKGTRPRAIQCTAKRRQRTRGYGLRSPETDPTRQHQNTRAFTRLPPQSSIMRRQARSGTTLTHHSDPEREECRKRNPTCLLMPIIQRIM